MPIYTYRCTECGIEFERHQNFSDAPLVKCPECGKKSLRKVFTPTGIIFKGSGFYATDNRSPSGQGTSLREKTEGATATAASKPAAESDAKPAATGSTSAATDPAPPAKPVEHKTEKNNGGD
jgi:putative FmdB family regulatory protein